MVNFNNVFDEIALILAIATTVGALAIWLRQPLIVAFIVVGILVGPAGLGLLVSSEQVELFAELGVALLLFVVGLKLDLHEIRAVGRVAITTGLGQIFLTGGLGYLLALGLGLDAISAFYVSLALTFSSTIVIVKLLSDKREIDALHGRIALGILIVQDIVVVLVMIALSAFSSNAEPSHLGHAILMMLVKGAGFLVCVILIARYLFPKLLHLFACSTELLLVFAIAWAIALAAIADGLGFSKEVGAFIAGVAIASTPYQVILGARLVGLRDFLLLFFFINLGIHIDVSHFGAALIPALILSLFVLIGKPLMVMVLLGRKGYRKYTSTITSLSLGQISEFSLILAALGVKLGHISPEVLGLITLVGLIAMGLSSYAIVYSHLFYEWLSDWLFWLDNLVPRDRRQLENLAETTLARIDVIVFGLGRYGGSLIRNLRQHGLRVLGVDFDPELVKFWRKEGTLALYGDAEDPEFATTLPLDRARWLVSTIPGKRLSLTLIHTLKHYHFQGRIVLTGHSDREKVFLQEAGADLVLLPFRDAAEEAARKLVSATPDRW